MTEILPFRGIRPKRSLTARVASLPYDVFNRVEAAEEAKKDALSFLNIDRPETQFTDLEDIYVPEVYQKANEMLQNRIQEGVFVQDSQKCYYLYELTMNGHSQTGLVACASIDDYISNTIRKHENTRAEKEADRIRHVDVCSMQTGPIFLAYRKNEYIADVTARTKQNEPLFDFTAEDGVHHRGWAVSDPEDMETIRQAFGAICEIYIADGHHRAASAVRVGLKRRNAHPDYTGEEEFNYFLSVLFPDDELTILDYNRVVKDLNGLSEQEFLERIQEKFVVDLLPSAQRPSRKGDFSMYLGNSWFGLTLRDCYREEDPVEGLDVSALQRELLCPVLGIQNPREDMRIDFVGGIRGLKELERRVHTDCRVAFALYPTSIQELFEVADAGLLMPPKSTWFEPKLRSGLFLHEIER